MKRGLSFLFGSLFLVQTPALSDEAEDLIRYYEKFNLDQAEQSIKSFLTAKYRILQTGTAIHTNKINTETIIPICDPRNFWKTAPV